MDGGLGGRIILSFSSLRVGLVGALLKLLDWGLT